MIKQSSQVRGQNPPPEQEEFLIPAPVPKPVEQSFVGGPSRAAPLIPTMPGDPNFQQTLELLNQALSRTGQSRDLSLGYADQAKRIGATDFDGDGDTAVAEEWIERMERIMEVSVTLSQPEPQIGRIQGTVVSLILIPSSHGPRVPETREADVKRADKTEGKLDVRGHRHIYNNSYQASIKMSPFDALYRNQCRTPFYWDEVGEHRLEVSDDVERTKEHVKIIKEKLKAAQDRQKSYADNRRKNLQFEVGD
ncbi:hypothetical protein L3X38_038294 [Prunus dulcis]|uniref:Reverse transcriptase domain-containing protein n=1 Tax=Prunus dulcis TaxID=3755 RepID=A0AAD4V786_PRUDU|nr:hypothetical protein L3X38_038294 [Prunus dulcis]